MLAGSRNFHTAKATIPGIFPLPHTRPFPRKEKEKSLFFFFPPFFPFLRVLDVSPDHDLCAGKMREFRIFPFAHVLLLPKRTAE